MVTVLVPEPLTVTGTVTCAPSMPRVSKSGLPGDTAPPWPWRQEASSHDATALPRGRPGDTGGTRWCWGRRVSGPCRCGAGARRACAAAPRSETRPSGAAGGAGDDLRAVDERGDLDR